MQLLDLTEFQSEGVGTLTKWTVKRDITQDKTFIFDAEMSFKIETLEEAEVVERMCPGAVTMYERGTAAKEAAKAETAIAGAAAGSTALAGVHGTVSVKITESNVDIIISDTEDNGGTLLVESAAQIINARLRSTGKSVVYLMKIRLHGLEAKESLGLFDALGETVTVSVEKRQQVLAFPTSSDNRPVLNIGDIASGTYGGAPYCGVVVGFSLDEDDERMVEIEDVSTSHIAPVSSAESVLQVCAQQGKTLDSTIRLFKKHANKRGVFPSWEHVVAAIVRQSGSEDQVISDGKYVLTSLLMSEAVEEIVADTSKAVSK